MSWRPVISVLRAGCMCVLAARKKVTGTQPRTASEGRKESGERERVRMEGSKPGREGGRKGGREGGKIGVRGREDSERTEGSNRGE